MFQKNLTDTKCVVKISLDTKCIKGIKRINKWGDRITIHYFLINYRNSGRYGRIAVEGEKEEIEVYLCKCSNDVRYIKSGEAIKRHEKGKRKLDCGVIRGFFFVVDMISSLSTKRLNYAADKRHREVR